MGYYPFGNKFFSDLVHYVRSGDFRGSAAAGLLRPQRVRLRPGRAGALLLPTIAGIPPSTASSPSSFPNCEKSMATRSPTADDPKAHIRTEFGFDMVQVAKNRYTSDRYHDFIGFRGVQAAAGAGLLRDLRSETRRMSSADVDLAIGSYRRGVSSSDPGDDPRRPALAPRRDRERHSQLRQEEIPLLPFPQQLRA